MPGTAFRFILFLSVLTLLAASSGYGEWNPAWDERSAIIAGANKGPTGFDRIGVKSWYDYTYRSNQVYAGYDKLYMYWKADLTRSATDIQQDAIAARNAHPGQTIWWSMSNEPNDRQQANQDPEGYGEIYLHFHKNLRIGDPDCMIIGPGILNWTFQSWSVFIPGHEWYSRFRQDWYNNAECRAYSEANYGVSYPPQDAFNFHSYDLRGAQGTPWAPISWEYCAEEIEMAYAALLDYPEILRKKIWLTEYSALRASDVDTNLNHVVGLIAWMRDQPYMERWFYFILTLWDQQHPWVLLNLLDYEGNLTKTGTVFRHLSTMPKTDRLTAFPAIQSFSILENYVRPGGYQTWDMHEYRDNRLRFSLVQNRSFSPSGMRGAKVSVPGQIYRISFDFDTNYDHSLVRLILDTNIEENVWQENRFGSNGGHVELEFPEGVNQLAFSLIPQTNFLYPHETGEWFGEVRNLIVYYTPSASQTVVIY